MLTFFIGVLSGFCLALPVGAVALMCINKTLQFGFKSGLAVGLGAAFADAFYAFIAIYSLTTISNIFYRLLKSNPFVIKAMEFLFHKQ